MKAKLAILAFSANNKLVATESNEDPKLSQPIESVGKVLKGFPAFCLAI